MVGVTGGTSTPIEDLEKVAERVYTLAGTDARRADAATLAHEALTKVAEPAYRSTSLDEKEAPGLAPHRRRGSIRGAEAHQAIDAGAHR